MSRYRLIASLSEMPLNSLRNIISSPSPHPAKHRQCQKPSLPWNTENEGCSSEWNGQRPLFLACSARLSAVINFGSGNRRLASAIFAARSHQRVGAKSQRSHRELSRLRGGNAYFLTCRDAAEAVPGMNHQTAYNINLALVRFGVIEILRVGDARPNGNASEFRYLLSQSENGAEEDDQRCLTSRRLF